MKGFICLNGSKSMGSLLLGDEARMPTGGLIGWIYCCFKEVSQVPSAWTKPARRYKNPGFFIVTLLPVCLLGSMY